MASIVRETGREITESPALFVRMADSQCAHGQDLLRPPESVRFDYEGEIAIVIGEGGRRIAEADAWKHIAGYSCYKRWQHPRLAGWRHRSGRPAKNFLSHRAASGPWLVTADDIKPDQKMTLTTRLNGQELLSAPPPT